jgi:hypothetical protein
VAAGAVTSCSQKRRPARPEGRMPLTGGAKRRPFEAKGAQCLARIFTRV